MNLTASQVTKKYDRFARFYNIVEWPIERMWYARWRKILLKSVKGKVLEIGVGTGKNLPYYNHSACSVTAVDISEGMINQAQKLSHKRKYPVKFKLLDNDFFPFDNNSFDFIICTFVLCSVPNQQRILKEMKRVVKKNGKILLLEHVLSKNRFLVFIENLHNPLTKWLLGVNINRDTISSIRKVGFKTIRDQNLALKDVFKQIEVTK